MSRASDAPTASPLSLDALFTPILRDRAGLALAVSGGSDSVALLALALDWAATRAKPPRLHVLTVDHGLRSEARDEARAVKSLATARDLPCDILTWEGPRPSTGLQANARAARYRLLIDRARALGLDALVTAHTLDDQAETLLMRLARGSGPRGLAGMAAETTRLGFPLVRPLLKVSRAALRAELTAHGIAYFDDPSNADPRFERVRWRALLPILASEGLDAAQLSRVAARCRRADDALEALTDTLATSVIEGADGQLSLDRAIFRRAPLELQMRVLSRVIERVAGGARDADLATPRYLMNDEKLAALATALSGEGSVRRTLGGVEATAQAAMLTFRRENPRRYSHSTHPAEGVSPYGVMRDDQTDLSGVRDPTARTPGKPVHHGERQHE